MNWSSIGSRDRVAILGAAWIVLAVAGASGCGGGHESGSPPAGPAGGGPAAQGAGTGAPAGGRSAGAGSATGQTPAEAGAGEAPGALAEPVYESELPDEVRALIDKPFRGDFDEMVKRRMFRIGVAYNRTHYFVDKGIQRGIAYEYGRLYEDELNVFIPMPRDLLLPALVNGKVDMVIAQLTITPERLAIVDFAGPTRRGIDEIVVTGPGAPTIATVDDLSGQEVFVRKTSSYYQSLVDLNQRLKAAGKPEVVIREAPETLEDDDLMEMVNAGLLRIIVVDDYLAQFWKQIFTNMRVHEDVKLRTGGNLGVAIRKNAPQLKADLNAFIATHAFNSAFANIIQKRYLASTNYAKSATSEAERRKLKELVQLFRKYGEQYDLDYLLMAAQGYQESGLNQDVKSHVGAIGVMQIMPATGKEMNVGDIGKLEPNIHAGVKYIRFMEDQYYKDEPMTPLDKLLFTFASYNAGPGRMAQLRRLAAKRGLDPNVWFGNVEQVASEKIGRETVTYVSNIYKYYIAYRLVMETRQRTTESKTALQPAAGTK
jgi:membrane-bound lytic murein transglycosylase MltF